MVINRFRDALFSDKAIGFRIDGDIVKILGSENHGKKKEHGDIPSGNLRSLWQIAN